MQERFKKYELFTVSEFVLDEDFAQWVKTPDNESKAFWQNFLLAHPEKAQTVAQAKRLLLALRNNPTPVATTTKDRLWASIQAKAAAPVKVVSLKRWWMAAASILVIAAASVLFLSRKDGFTTVQTQYGEFKEILLPDHSVVTLNGNSSLRFKKNWQSDALREVWIDGEAFFAVKHLNQAGQPVKTHERFVVHAKDVDVEVLGTSFSVNVRQQEAKVILQSGKVQLRFEDGKIPAMEMQPGEKVVYARNEKLQKEKVRTGELVLWKSGKLTFDSTSLRDVFTVMKNDFGYRIAVPDSAVLNRTITGTVPTDNKDVLLKALSVAMNLNIRLRGDTLAIEQ